MGTENRLPSPDPAPPRRGVSPPFYRVDRKAPDGHSRHYVVHTRSPKFVVEFDRAPDQPTPGTNDAIAAGPPIKSRPVIRRVCVPNSWAGDYHQCARQLGAATEFFGATGDADA